ncbi:MAG: hypothetical protein AB1721_03065 [Patescibacteria group bacterium]
MLNYYKTVEDFMNACGYLIDGRWYPRVTSIVSIKSKPALLYFYAEAKDYSSALSVTSQSAEEGTMIHNAIEAILKNETPEINEQIEPAIKAFHDFLTVHQVKIDQGEIEKRVWSPKHSFAGTVDVLGEVDGEYGVLDIKTSSGIWRDYNLQTSAYMGALMEKEPWEKLSPQPIKKRWILRIDQQQVCLLCGAKKRTKGGREKIKNGFDKNCVHQWSEVLGEWELKALENFESDFQAFLAAKRLWEWENEKWLKQI